MAVYVDGMAAPFGRMIMCHMVADTREELDAMADRIGVHRKWRQKTDTPQEHYDICKSMRVKAVAAGAIKIGPRDLCRLMNDKRKSAQPPRRIPR